MADTNQYRDPTNIPGQNEFTDEIAEGPSDQKSKTLAKWLRTKMYGIDVREALAIFVEWLATKYGQIKANMIRLTSGHNTLVDKTTELEQKFTDVVANATQDSEVIDARASNAYGAFDTLDARIENLESIIQEYVPSGTILQVYRDQGNAGVKFSITEAKYNLSILSTGLDTEPSGSFGGTVPSGVSGRLISYAGGIVSIAVPMKYAEFKFITRSGNTYVFAKDETTINLTFDGGQPATPETGEEATVIADESIPSTPKDLAGASDGGRVVLKWS